jgi:hypothetical protein
MSSNMPEFRVAWERAKPVGRHLTRMNKLRLCFASLSQSKLKYVAMVFMVNAVPERVCHE